MNCYRHADATAVGFCKFCGKGVCHACARDTRAGLSCSEVCEKHTEEALQMHERALVVYGIGETATRGLPTQVYGLILFAAGFGGYAIYDKLFDKGWLTGFFGFFSFIFLLGAMMTWWKFRKHRINV